MGVIRDRSGPRIIERISLAKKKGPAHGNPLGLQIAEKRINKGVLVL